MVHKLNTWLSFNGPCLWLPMVSKDCRLSWCWRVWAHRRHHTGHGNDCFGALWHTNGFLPWQYIDLWIDLMAWWWSLSLSVILPSQTHIHKNTLSFPWALQYRCPPLLVLGPTSRLGLVRVGMPGTRYYCHHNTHHCPGNRGPCHPGPEDWQATRSLSWPGTSQDADVWCHYSGGDIIECHCFESEWWHCADRKWLSRKGKPQL